MSAVLDTDCSGANLREPHLADGDVMCSKLTIIATITQYCSATTRDNITTSSRTQPHQNNSNYNPPNQTLFGLSNFQNFAAPKSNLSRMTSSTVSQKPTQQVTFHSTHAASSPKPTKVLSTHKPAHATIDYVILWLLCGCKRQPLAQTHSPQVLKSNQPTAQAERSQTRPLS